jgi:4-carboxymuconolactone decarboxylase
MTNTPRYREYTRDELTPDQQAVFDSIAAPRAGQVPAPFHVLLESPELALLTQALGAYCRFRTGFEPRLSELIVLIVAAHWGADYEFSLHAPIAMRQGIPEAVAKAIGARKVPQLDDPEAKLIYDFVTTFFAKNDVPDPLFEQAIAQFGRRRVVELTGVLGYYSSLAILLRIFRVAPSEPRP